MIEQIGAPGFDTISKSNHNATAVIEALRAIGNEAPVIAEIGVGIGATTLAMAKG
jgi:tRNA G46 methylase TrmB